MRSRAVRLLLGSSLIVATAGVFLATTGSPAPAAASVAPVVSNVIGASIPGATGLIVPSTDGTGNLLSITAPSSAFLEPGTGVSGIASPPPPPDGSDVYQAGEAGWRAGMAAAYAASNDPTIVGWTLQPPSAMSPLASNYLSARLRPGSGATVGWPSATLIGQAASSTISQQIASNVAVLRTVLGAKLTAVATDVFPVGAGTYAVEVDLQVSLLSDVAPHVGDVFLGMATGLAGAPNATVEGLAINVVDASGARGSVWINGRDGDGSGAGDPQLNPDDAHQAGVSFPNLTGGPALSTSENGATTRAPARP